MRAISLSAAALAAILLFTSQAPAEKKDLIVGFPGFAEYGRRPIDPEEAAKQPEITKDTEFGGRKLAEWVKLLDDSKDESERERAVRAIASYGPVAKDLAASALLKHITDNERDVGVRCKAIIVLSAIGVADKDKLNFIKLLAHHAGEPSQQVLSRYHALLAVVRYAGDLKGSDPADFTYIIGELVPAATDERSWEVRTVCLRALGDVGRLQRAMVIKKADPLLKVDARPFSAAVARLSDLCADVRREAAETIFVLGPPDDKLQKDQTIGIIRQRLKTEPEPEVKIWFNMAAMSIDGFKEEFLSELSGYFGHKDPFVREQAVNAMGTLGKEAKPKIKNLIGALEDKEAQVSFAAIVALANIAGSIDSAVIKDDVVDALNQVPRRPADFPKPIADALRSTAVAAAKYVKEGPPKGSGSGSGSGSK